jgi:O-antigen/teichoic acid export membrane protein
VEKKVPLVEIFITQFQKILTQPNVLPLIVRSFTFPIQFLISMYVWKIVYTNSSNSSLESVLVMTSVSFISTVLLLGSHTNIGNRIIDRSEKASEAFTFAMAMPILILLFAIPLIIAFPKSVFRFFLISNADYTALIVLVLAITLLAPSAAFQSILISKGQNFFVSVTPVIGTLFSLPIGILLLQNRSPSLTEVYVVLISSSLFSTLFLAIKAFKLLDLKAINWNFSIFKTHANIGSLLISIAAPLAFQLDRVLITHLGRLDDSLKSAPVNRIVASVMLILSTTSMAFWPNLRLRKNNKLVRMYTINSMLSSIPFIVVFFLIGPGLVKYFTNGRVNLPLGDQFAIALFILVYSSAIVPTIVLADVSGQVKVFMCMLLSSTVTIALSYLSIPRLGLSGYYYAGAVSVFLFVFVPLYNFSLKQF